MNLEMHACQNPEAIKEHMEKLQVGYSAHQRDFFLTTPSRAETQPKCTVNK